MLLEKGPGLIVNEVGEQRDSQEIFLLGVLDGVFQKFAAETLPAKVLMNDQVLQDNYEASLGRADGNEQVHHANNAVTGLHDENSTPIWLLEDQAQAAHLFIVIRPKVGLMGKKIGQEIRQLWQIVEARRLDSCLGTRHVR